MSLPVSGLTYNEVRDRINNGLTNKYVPQKVKTIPEILIQNAFTIFNIVNAFIIAFLLYFYFSSNDIRLLWDSIGIITVTVINTILSMYQEIKATVALSKVDLLKNQMIYVIRDGERQKIKKEDIVKDDVIFLQKGDQIVVDGTILHEKRLEIDESLVTGESIPIEKYEGDKIISGSFCVFGNGYYRAEKIGKESYAAGITQSAKKLKFKNSPLQNKINTLFIGSIVIVIIMVLLESIISFQNGITISNVRKISTIAVSLVPEGLVFFSTVTFMIGIYRIAGIGAIIQKINAIDMFSTIDVVCMDKTGTLTQNKISVAKVVPLNGQYEENELKKILGTYGYLSNDKNATINALEKFDRFNESSLKDDIPFSSESKVSAIRMNIKGETETYFLGAFDILSEMINSSGKKSLDEKFEEENLRGFRTLLFGKIKNTGSSELDLKTLKNAELTPLCIIGMKDEAREDAMDALKLFNKNKIKVKILSGDATDSVLKTLEEVGYETEDHEVITGSKLETLSDEEFRKTVVEKFIFTRLKPEQKTKIVESLKQSKFQTAFIGDGVNDLPAIKEADLGIAMEEGSSITKETADIILMKNKFTLLPDIFDEGNKIINTVTYVSRIFLGKTSFIGVLSILTWFFVMIYPLTPRTSSLISVLAVGIPSYVIAVINKNVNAGKSFYADIFSFIGITTVSILTVSLLQNHILINYWGISAENTSLAMLATMIFLFTFNYLAGVLFDDTKNIAGYIKWGFYIIGIYLFFSLFEIDFFPMNIARSFYEVEYIPFELLPPILVFAIPGGFLLFFLQWLRHKFIIEKNLA